MGGQVRDGGPSACNKMNAVSAVSGRTERKACPVCRSADVLAALSRRALPVFQNVVLPSQAEAISAPAAEFQLVACRRCGFSYNAVFDPSLVVYDESYDNAVPSTIFRDYYRSLVGMLAERFDLRGGTVYDIGCGKGEFLEMLCAGAPGIQGIGIDPSCTPTERGNFRLVKAFLEPSHFAADTRLIIVRHVLEHIPDPRAFLAMLYGCVPDAPVFFEVPEFGWILKNGAFWDFCYEHCNYFTSESLGACLAAEGFATIEQRLSFGGQYQWALCRKARVAELPTRRGDAIIEAVRRYSMNEAAQIARMVAAAEQNPLVVWGMATKGVVLCSLIGGERIAGGVDINSNKQGKFAPVSGVRINSPEWTRTLPPGCQVLAMNPNYVSEITALVRELGSKAEVVTTDQFLDCS